MEGLNRVCLVVPCFNEAARLNVQEFRQCLAQNLAARLVFVDDGSRDNTLQVLAEVCRGYESRTTVLPRSPNRGKADAVRSGINHALSNFQQEVIGYWDADLSTPLDCVPRFLAVLDQRPHIEMVFGSRVKLLGRYVERRATRHYLGRVFATIVSLMLRLPIYDTQCGAKLFRANSDLPQVFAEPFLSKWVFDVEIIARYLRLYGLDAKRLEKAIYEYPLEVWIDVAGSKVRATDFVTAFADVLRIHRKYLA